MQGQGPLRHVEQLLVVLVVLLCEAREATTSLVRARICRESPIGIIVGIIQLTGGFSLFSGGGYGRFIGIFAATLGAIESLFAIGGPHPWWALGIFVVSLWVLHGLIVFSEDFEARPSRSQLPTTAGDGQCRRTAAVRRPLW